MSSVIRKRLDNIADSSRKSETPGSHCCCPAAGLWHKPGLGPGFLPWPLQGRLRAEVNTEGLAPPE